jgi:hypothetical protein
MALPEKVLFINLADGKTGVLSMTGEISKNINNLAGIFPSMQYKLKKGRFFPHLLTSLLFIMLAPPIVLLDILAEVYHHVGFRLCGMPLVKRSAYVIIDRHKLQYLNAFDKVACAYCGYANGLIAYWREVGARTESYWCAIKHQKKPGRKEQAHQKEFLKYGDKRGFEKRYGKANEKKN